MYANWEADFMELLSKKRRRRIDFNFALHIKELFRRFCWLPSELVKDMYTLYLL